MADTPTQRRRDDDASSTRGSENADFQQRTASIGLRIDVAHMANALEALDTDEAWVPTPGARDWDTPERR